MKKFFLLIINILLISFYCNAAYLTSVPRTVVQPNGDTLHCFITGDEFHHWLHDKDGYTIMQDPATGYYVYATSDGNSLIPTSYIAGNVNPSAVGLAPYQNISATRWKELRKQMESIALKDEPAFKGEKNHGRFNNLVVFINFQGEDGFISKFSDVQNMCNDSTENAISMYNFFKQMSFNQLALTSYFFPAAENDVIQYYTDPNPRNYYLAYSVNNPKGYQNETQRIEREHTLLVNALKYIEPMIPEDLNLDANEDGRVDNVDFIIKGEVSDWNSLLWPHKWYLSTKDCSLHGKQVYVYNLQLEGSAGYFNTSVLCHEMFHTLGAPDLYHYEGNTVARSLTPVGAWDLMANNTEPPQQTAAYMKYKYGHWIDDIPTITYDGEYVLYPGNSNHPDKMCYKIGTNRFNEFFILEYRKKSEPNDNTLYGSGLLVYRVNTNVNGNSNYDGVNTFDELYLFRPNGTTKSNGDITHAHFDGSEGRDHIDINTNPFPYFCDGTKDSTFQITYIGEPGDSLVFRIGNYYAYCDQEEITFENKPSTRLVPIHSNTSWKITSDFKTPDWIQINPISGTGDTVIAITTLTENTDVKGKEYKIKITGDSIVKPQSINILQKGTQAYLELSADTLIFDKDHLSYKIYIHTNAYWGISSSLKEFPWISLDKEYGPGGDDTLTVTISNISKFNREGTLYFKGGGAPERIGVFLKQAGIVPILYLGIDPEQEGPTADGNTRQTILVENKIYSFNTKVHANMDWRLIPNETWISFTPSSGSGDQDITINILDTNANVANHRTLFTLYGEEDQVQYYDLTQEGIPFEISTDPQTIELGNILGNKTIKVKANASWSAYKSNSWFTAQGNSSVNDSTLTIQINAFNYTSQKNVDTLFIHGPNYDKDIYPFVITQDTAYIYLSKDTLLVENLAGSSAVLKLRANTRWYINSLCSKWISASKTYGTNDLDITFYAKETTTEERCCTMTVTDRKGINKTLVLKQLTSVGIHGFSAENISVYPNPAHDILNIYNNQVRLDKVMVYDMQGRCIVSKKNIGDFATTLNVSSLASGVYTVKIIGEGQVATKRIVIQ